MPLSAVFSQTGIVAVARFDGAEMSDADNVFFNFYNAFRFPEYFGWNWDALSDCLRDLNWYPADRYLILIDRAEQVLVEEEGQRKLLFAILRRAAIEWAEPMMSGRRDPVFFKVLLVCGEPYLNRLRAELELS